MTKYLKTIFITLLSFFLNNSSISASENNIYDKIELFGEVLDKINK